MARLLFSLSLYCLLLLVLPACAGSLTYSAEVIEAKVIDAETRKPLEGVIVTANWQLEQGTMGGNIQVGQLMVMEAVTDNEGQFLFPAWGPKTTRESFLVNDDPQILLFKSGYEYRRLNNPYSSNRELRLRSERRSQWNGKTIEMKPFKGTSEEYATHLSFVSLSWAYRSDNCEWKQIPRLVTAVHEQAMTFHQRGITHNLFTIESLIPYPGYPDKCGAREYFRGRRQ